MNAEHHLISRKVPRKPAHQLVAREEDILGLKFGSSAKER